MLRSAKIDCSGLLPFDVFFMKPHILGWTTQRYKSQHKKEWGGKLQAALLVRLELLECYSLLDSINIVPYWNLEE